jgi:hypothetical protein
MRPPPLGRDSLENPRHIVSGQSLTDPNRQALTAKVID